MWGIAGAVLAVAGVSLLISLGLGAIIVEFISFLIGLMPLFTITGVVLLISFTAYFLGEIVE